VWSLLLPFLFFDGASAYLTFLSENPRVVAALAANVGVLCYWLARRLSKALLLRSTPDVRRDPRRVEPAAPQAAPAADLPVPAGAHAARHRRDAPPGRRALGPAELARLPEKGMYTGILITGATGSAKTSAAQYPFTAQLIHLHASDPARKMGGLIIDAKGNYADFVQDQCARAGRLADYYEVSLTSGVKWNIVGRPDLNAAPGTPPACRNCAARPSPSWSARAPCRRGSLLGRPERAWVSRDNPVFTAIRRPSPAPGRSTLGPCAAGPSCFRNHAIPR
jgi:hypothetical protein